MNPQHDLHCHYDGYTHSVITHRPDRCHRAPPCSQAWGGWYSGPSTAGPVGHSLKERGEAMLSWTQHLQEDPYGAGVLSGADLSGSQRRGLRPLRVHRSLHNQSTCFVEVAVRLPGRIQTHRCTSGGMDLYNKYRDIIHLDFQTGENLLRKDQRQSNLRCFSLEFHKLLGKIQGAPLLKGATQLELTVLYNASVFSIAMSEFSKVELLITNVMDKVFKISGCRHTPGSADYLLFWIKALEKAIKHTDLECGIRHLFCLQWAIWLATQQYHIICETEKEMILLISTENKKGELSEPLLSVLEPKELIELLHVCTLIVQGAERFRGGQHSEALSDIEKATSLTAPRGVVACTHLLLGSCFHQMKRPQMALTCFRRAMETDGHCISALYQSMLVYRQLENKQAEIQALELLHSVLNLTHSSECNTGDGLLISSELLLSSSSLKNLLEVPSGLTVLHSLALQCVRFGRVSEGVEHYLDLLAILHTGQPNPYHMHMDVPFLPRLTVLYLEAAAAMLMVQRPADCIALCDEVSTTLDLLPQRLVLEELSVETEPSTPDVDHDDKGAMVLCAGAANLLKGHCYMHLKDLKQAMAHYTRCLDLLLRVHFKIKGCQPQIPSADMVDKEGSKLFILQRLKAFSLAGRGICFAQTDRLKESLRELHLSLHAFPECVNAGLWCGEVLWRLKRRHEAACCWKKTWGFTPESSNENVCVYLIEPPTDHMLNPTELQQRIENLGFEDNRNA